MPHLRRLWTVLTCCLAAGLFVVAPAAAHAAVPSYLSLEASYSSVANGWSKVERYLDTTPGYTQESYPPDGRGVHRAHVPADHLGERGLVPR